MLGEVVVTASKREENLQRAALSITALGADDLESRAVTDAGQLAGLAPGVQIQPYFILLTYMRGVGNFSAQPAVDQSIAYNVDGIYLDRPYAVPNILFDLERVELLRGPQGTLQGRNSTGGSLDFITARPTKDFAAQVSLTAGNYSLLSTEGMLNLPLGESTALRLSAASSEHDGYMKNGFGDSNANGARARFLATPTSELEILVTGEYTRRDENGPTNSPCPPGSVDAACAGVRWDPFAGTPGQGTDPVRNMDEPNMLQAESSALYAEINYDLDFGVLTWVPAYRYHKYRNLQSYSQTFGFYPAVHDHMHSQELRLASAQASPVKWVIGAYFGRQNTQEKLYFTTGIEPYITVDEPGFPSIGHVSYRNDVDGYVYRSQSLFGQVSVPLSERFRLVGGLRYTEDKKSLHGRVSIVVPGPSEVGVNTQARQALDKLTYKAGVEYDLTPEILTYANVSTGFKSGGVNAVPPTSGLPATFQPENNTAYQTGFKGRFLNDRLQVNTEAFYYNYRGYLASAFGVTPEGVLVALNVNSQKARMYGGEIETAFLVTPRDRLDVSLAALSAKYKEFVIPSAGLSLTGMPMQNAPGLTVTTNYTRTFPLVRGGDIAAHVEVRYESDQWVDYRMSAGSYQPGFWRESADVTYNSADDKWSVGAFIRNISNNGAIMTAINGVGTQELAYPYAPRTYGVRVTSQF